MTGKGSVAVVDIGTNSMRLLLVASDGSVIARRSVVTGLGRGVDATGRLSIETIQRTVDVLREYGDAMSGFEVCRAIATSATRDAANREEFLDMAEEALGVRPEVITGQQEARFAFRGAMSAVEGQGVEGQATVVDIGGGSTEFVWEVDDRIEAVSVDIGSVRLTDRLLEDRPVEFDRLEEAAALTEQLLDRLVPGDLTGPGGLVVGVAGTWTTLAAMISPVGAPDNLPLTRHDLDSLVLRLAASTIDEIAVMPGIDPARAPVILGGAIVARAAMRHLSVDQVTISERDLLDGVAASMSSAT